MLNEKQYLLLCELADTGLLNAQRSGSVMAITRSLLPALTLRKQADLAKAILECSNFADLELVEQSSDRCHLDRALFLNKEQQQCVIVIFQSKESEEPDTYSFLLDTMVHTLQEELPLGVNTVLTGLGQNGWHAALMAEILDEEAVVFGAPTIEELPGKAVNYVGENDPVGDHTEKVVFVKEADDLEDEEIVPLFRKHAFDESGRAIVSEQSEFSRFVSWFYNTSGTIEPVIWNFFFPGTEEDEATVLADLGVYSVFLKVGELNNERVLRSIGDIMRYVAGKLESNRNQLAAELDKLPDDDYDNQVSETANNFAKQAEDFIMRTFESVQTMFMGVALFTLGQESFDTNPLIDNFHRQLHELLDQELERVTDCLDQAIARRLDRFFQLPSFHFEW
ncbi:hypothetical protein [Paenibacillus motobuensis]|uniref:Uncharacterized protein n=1 Tax=Paenibacillus motobuensis TaxID=295324 RepID=A0ABN0Y0C8_9BACL